jgi:hypothetical protein
MLYVFGSRPNGPKVNSQGRKPLEWIVLKLPSPNGAKVTIAPFGAYVSNSHILTQGLTPLAIHCRRVAAKDRCTYMHNFFC